MPSSLATFSLESGYIDGAVGIKFAELEVEQGCADKFGGGESLVVGRCRVEAVDHILGYHLACDIVAGVLVEQLGFESPVFVNLRGQFHEVAVDVSACLAFVAGACEHAVKAVAKFVEHSFHFVECKKRGCAGSGLGEVADVEDYGTRGCAVGVLP